MFMLCFNCPVIMARFLYWRSRYWRFWLSWKKQGRGESIAWKLPCIFSLALALEATHTCTHTHTVQGDLASPLTFIASSCWFCHLDRNQNVVLILSGALVLHTLNYLLLSSIQNTVPSSSLPYLTVPSSLRLGLIFFRPIILFLSLSRLFIMSQRNSPPSFMASSIYSNFLL